MLLLPSYSLSFFFNDTATTEIYTLSLHDALPISPELPDGSIETKRAVGIAESFEVSRQFWSHQVKQGRLSQPRSEEHTSVLQSQSNLVCRLLLEKKKSIQSTDAHVSHGAIRTRHL